MTLWCTHTCIVRLYYREATYEVGAVLRAIHKSQNAVDGAVGQVCGWLVL